MRSPDSDRVLLNQRPRHIRVEHVMGTVVSVDVRDPGPRATAAVDDVLAWLHEVDARFSTYRPESEISRIAQGTLVPVRASRDVRWVLERCEALREETGGFFDAYAGGSLDPSALVKGWSVQRAAEMLGAAGFTDFCLSAGGDVACRGSAGPGGGWRTGIQHPHDRTALAAVVVGSDLAIATSGTYERGAHILDPRTGEPPVGVLSVTITGPDLGTADAYATAAFAMGADGPAWTLGLRGYEAMTILHGDVVLCTPGFPTA